MNTSRNGGFQATRKPVFSLLGFAAIIKISVLLISGPSFHLDSNSYNAYANAILDHGRAFAPVVWGAEASPLFIFRFPGYPLVLAGAKLVSAEHYAFLSLLFCSYFIYRVVERLLLSSIAGLLVAGFYLFSESMLYDNSIL